MSVMSMTLPDLSAADAFEHAPDPAAHLTADGALIKANAAFRAAFPHAVKARRPPWGRVSPPAFVGGVRRFDAPAPDGRLYEWVERRLLDGSRIAIARDVTERATAAAEADRAKTSLFATLTHELRTPLNGILGMAGLMAQSRLDPEASDHLRAIRQSGEHLLDLINEILDYSRLEAGKLTLEDALFDPEALAQSVAELLSPKAHEKGIDIAVLIRPGLPGRVRGDASRFRQILFNLAGNAVKFTDKGGVLIELGASANGRLRLVVRDTGAGIAQEKQAEIFEEFAQADASIARTHGGAGLGLSIVRKLARAMEGEVGVDSKPGRGAAFWVELPLPFSHGANAAARLDGLRVGLLSPSEIIARSLEAALAGLGADVVRLEDAVSPAPCDVLLVDQAAMLSHDMLRALIARERALIALAPQEERETISRCREAGIEHYVVKPVRRASLAERIRIAVGRGAAVRLAAHEDDRAHNADLSGLRVLLADDNPINTLLARTLFTRAGAVVDAASDGEEAVAAANAAPYDLILLDLRMPRLDGLSAARRIRGEKGPSAGAVIIALTANSSETDRRAALEAGMDDFVTKPIDPARLAAGLARFTGRAKPATFSRD